MGKALARLIPSVMLWSQRQFAADILGAIRLNLLETFRCTVLELNAISVAAVSDCEIGVDECGLKPNSAMSINSGLEDATMVVCGRQMAIDRCVVDVQSSFDNA